MAEIKKSTAAKPAATKQAASAKPAPKREMRVVFERENYIIFFVGLAVIFIGFLVMMGGKTTDPNTFNADEIFAWRRINLAPTLVLLGFGIEILAILYRKKKKAE